ncbi:Riboflavin synthase domain-like protein [Mycena kentingensis (nom. inval.)]|nr:Riboflavin synthase domain-like protein [Mycena kentingensis (nom. inval.)]
MSDRVLILYATESGTAQHVADRIFRQCNRIRVPSRVSNIAHYPLRNLVDEPLIIFVVSTTGSGLAPRSMNSLWQSLLRSDLPSDLFEDLRFAVFGLGDSAYEKFCWPAKKLVRRLETLGAEQLCPHGEADDQDPLGIDGALEPWLERTSITLLRHFSLPLDLASESTPTLPPPRAVLVPSTAPLEPQVYPGNRLTTVKCNSRITSPDWNQDVRHLEFEFDNPVEYRPGDVAVVRPIAPSADVDALLERLGWLDAAEMRFSVEHQLPDLSLPEGLPSSVTLRDVFTHHLDFRAVPRRSFFLSLLHFTTDELEVERLREFLSRDGADELYEYCFRVRRTIAEVLADFRQVQIPMDYIFDIFPPLRPREFSIASSMKMHPQQVHLCVAIVKYRTKLKIPRRGVCTTYLSGLEAGDRVQLALKSGLITLPAENTPIICVGPGTGVAPMRAIIQERIHSGAFDNTLYFGCRSAHKDQHYAEEWKSFAARGALSYRTAFSRDGPEGVARVYVQDLIAEDSQRIWDLLRVGATVFISGSSNKMPAAIRSVLCAAVEKHGNRSPEDAVTFVSQMEDTGRLLEESWS